MSLAEAMKRHPKCFDALFCNMIAAGEAGGILDTILKRLAVYIEKAVKLKSQVQVGDDLPDRRHRDRRASSSASSCGRSSRPSPSLFAGLGAELPLPTRIVIALSNNLIRFMPFLFVGFFAFGWAFQHLLRDREGPPRDRRDHAEDADPRADPAQDRGGAVLPHAVDADGVGRADSRRPRHHRATSGNAIIEDAIQETRKSIERGETIAAPLKETGVFPGMVVQMISVGEATGALDTMLGKIADFYEEEVDVAVEGLLTLLEPVMIAFLGGAVGGIVIAMYMPIFDLISKLTG